ncbi:hypothetical protein, partial [Bacillus mobilis]|uniref:hypothetical protein n=2 Tax=Bacillati TaxID=1783272 RepID=UPI003640A423
AWTGAYRVIDMFGMASIALALGFSVFGVLLRRYAPLAAPLVLLAAAIPHTLDGYASAAVWWLGTAVAVLWAVSVAARLWHQLRAVRRLAQASITGRTTMVGPNAVRAVNRSFRRGLLRLLLLLTVACGGWAMAVGVLPSELGRTYAELGEQSASNVFAAAGIAASIMTVAEAVRQGWHVLALGQVGRRLVWEIPAGRGVAPWWPYARNDAGTVPIEAAEAPGCSCLAEFRRAYPDGEGDLRMGEGVPASAYCRAHGIDRINELTAAEFITMSEETWLWEGGTRLPEPADPDAKRLLLYSFAGHTFGGIPVRKLRGRIDADFPGVRPAHEADPEDFGPWWDNPLRPEAGVQDTIDLQAAGYTGSAFRYRHGRAWFEAAPPFVPESEP